MEVAVTHHGRSSPGVRERGTASPSVYRHCGSYLGFECLLPMMKHPPSTS